MQTEDMFMNATRLTQSELKISDDIMIWTGIPLSSSGTLYLGAQALASTSIHEGGKPEDLTTAATASGERMFSSEESTSDLFGFILETLVPEPSDPPRSIPLIDTILFIGISAVPRYLDHIYSGRLSFFSTSVANSWFEGDFPQNKMKSTETLAKENYNAGCASSH